ncbi:MAG: exodeoxyribonuclease VII small subunit [Ferrovibrio sp.]|uniref:exodeoxyribonuclease VII small subunit n=1 Tax=Ferrovibrio sp. TaxID=1917215 RepID=UPI0026251E83|nr:exodeoxyribonuclease VII small subunit [Ferrovibrio sp.]MCW0235850.1 exodeoxyribonuclease VII small subunit [Ferrovibrio sp.]
MSKADKEAHQETIPPDIAAMSFEAALKALDEIVTRLEGGRVDLEDSIALYGRGALLKRHCEAKLKAAEEKIEKIVVGADGQAATQPFKAD